jgi:transcription antitermination factor NusG
MQKNWYAVYTKPHCEKKVSLSLTKKNIETFCPLNYKKSRQFFTSRPSGDPIFNCYVFVKSTDSEIIQLTKHINDAVSVLYWKGKPATIKEEEINAIKEFTVNHQDIRLEKMNSKSSAEENDISYLMDGQILLVKNRTMELKLPSLGLTMIAKLPEGKLKEDSLWRNKRSFGNKELILPSWQVR